MQAHGREVYSVDGVAHAVTGGDCNTGPQEIPVGHSTAVHCAGGNDELTLECYQNMINCDKDFRFYPIGT